MQEKQENQAGQNGLKSIFFDAFEVDNVQTHDFERNTIIEGTITKHDSITIGSRQAEYIDIKTDTGDIKRVWVTIVLKTQMSKCKPVIGDYIGIKYLGKRKSKNGMTYKDFKMVI